MTEDELFEEILEHHGLSDDYQRKIADMIEKYKNMDVEEKRKFIAYVQNTLKKKLNKYVSTDSNWMDMLVGRWATLISVVLIVSVFVFFGYKLYKSLSERERKREEKKKNKQMKKKK